MRPCTARQVRSDARLLRVTLTYQCIRAICVKNAVDFLVCTITWVAIGYGFAFGPEGGEFLGGGIWPLFADYKIDSSTSEWCTLPCRVPHT